ncbi:hypothetical protein M404DRAFT_1004839 [Pisolithus tinctorius Marx 270]|uniref:Uncharacterized protein n=1 Tax=Pisolithus tinctorius Marx 270 TaxID=870435 RepID=A0A0C3JNU2_PISTI|nr:hypothetical protein M404DRAFT_1004839 [Pisolithus tinctorius Marx 270]
MQSCRAWVSDFKFKIAWEPTWIARSRGHPVYCAEFLCSQTRDYRQGFRSNTTRRSEWKTKEKVVSTKIGQTRYIGAETRRNAAGELHFTRR